MQREVRGTRILVAGLGNLLLQDDGAGVHAVRLLEQDPPPGICLAEVGTAVVDALHLLEWAGYVLAVDALQAGGAPGTVYRCASGDVADEGLPASLHELGLLSVLRMLAPEAAPEVAILGVEPQVIDYGLELSPAVQAALPTVEAAVRSIVDGWCPDPAQREAYVVEEAVGA